ncbi:MAG: cysteine hydrolase [Ruminococcus sp.]|nr:cysteine hydrolase [Ruminococcus sp.]HAE51877.1 amidase [Ruminococcus sp.]
MKILAVIDMQNDFIDGSLGTKEAENIVPAVAEKIKSFKNSGDEIVFTRDTHHENYLSTMEGKKLPVVHCVKNTKGWEISDKLDTSDCTIIDKPTFGSYDLAEFIAGNPQIDEVVLVGLCTDICVISNAMLIKAKLPEIKITVDSSCCAGVTPQSHENALSAMKMCHIDII